MSTFLQLTIVPYNSHSFTTTLEYLSAKSRDPIYGAIKVRRPIAWQVAEVTPSSSEMTCSGELYRLVNE